MAEGTDLTDSFVRLVHRPVCLSVPLSEVLHRGQRLEAEGFLTGGYVVRRDLESLPVTGRLGDCARIWQPSRLKGIIVRPEFGTPFLSATQTLNVWPSPRKWLARDRTPKVEERFVDHGWILVTCSGTVGIPIIAYRPHLNTIISHDILRVQTDAQLRGYVYTFLRTRYARTMMRSSHYGNIIKHLEVEHLEALPLPFFEEFADELQQEIDDIFAMRNEAYGLDMSARGEFSAACGALDKPQTEESFSVPSDSLFGESRRLDASAHHPDALAVLETLKESARELVPLGEGELATAFQPSRFARVYGENGIPFLSSEQLFDVNPEIKKFLMEATDVELSGLKVKAGWLLMARSGQVYGINGSVCIATEWHESKVITDDLIRIVPSKAIRPGYLQVALSHPQLGRPLVMTRAYGTSIPHLEAPDIETVPIARFSKCIEDSIADKAERASILRMRADEKENGAVSKLEQRIEKEIKKTPKKARKYEGKLSVPMDFNDALRLGIQVKTRQGDE